MPGYKLPTGELLEKGDASVSLKSIIETDFWKTSDAKLPIALGKDFSGNLVIADLAKVKHMIIAGIAGTGKSVCLDSIIMSLLFRLPPSDVEFFLIDSMSAGLMVYESLPHLVTPVVHERRKIPAVLHWCVNEMDRRTRILSKAGATNIYEFNMRNKGVKASTENYGERIPNKLPSIVIVIEELTDILKDKYKDYLGDRIVEIAARGANAGLHLLISTQIPWKKDMSSIIQKNILSRIAFRLLSSDDSQKYIGKACAERLNNSWDMFFLKTANSELRKIHGAFISKEEVGKVVDLIKRQITCEFDTRWDSEIIGE